jgi:polysaccharide pyruvyl transferase WcaK-like protein
MWASPFSGNMGVNALTYSAVYLVQQASKKLNIDVDIVLIAAHKDIFFELKIADETIPVTCWKIRKFEGYKFLIKKLFFKKKYGLDKISKLDIVFDISEGDSFTDIYGQDRFDSFIGSKIFFNKRNIPQLMLPQTIGPFKKIDNENKAFSEMSKMTCLLPRDKLSYNYVKKNNVNNSISELIDLAFFLPFNKSVLTNDKINVGINISGLLWSGGYTGKNQFQLKCDYKQIIEKLIEYFLTQSDVKIHLVSHVVPENQPVESDYLVAKEIAEKYPSCVVVEKFADPVAAKSFISGLDFFTGARMHACIAAFSSGIPVVPMAYSRKFNGLFKETLGYQPLADCVNQSLDEVFETIVTTYQNRINIAKSIGDILNTKVGDRKEMLYSEIVRALSDVS